MVTEDPVDLNLTMSPSSRKMPALLTKNSAQPCQIESYGEIMWTRVHPIDDNEVMNFKLSAKNYYSWQISLFNQNNEDTGQRYSRIQGYFHLTSIDLKLSNSDKQNMNDVEW